MTTTFTEHVEIETGFSKVFSARIVPRLAELEDKRKAILAVAKRHAIIALAVTLACIMSAFITVATAHPVDLVLMQPASATTMAGAVSYTHLTLPTIYSV